MSSNTSAMDEHLANMRALRAIVGPEPKEQQLVDLLRRYPSVNQAANAFFDGSAKGHQQQPNVIYQQQQPPQVVVVQSSPYVYGYGGYGYGYDPFLGGMLGFAGGMLIADAMFY